ncbi:MAG TPA: neuromedin U [Candidatus Angelobacter sp.]|nr:neuromedin U [Candidatus Angelobacter sp.]
MLLFALTALAQQKPPADEDEHSQKLQKDVQNPVANLISVPFQNNMNPNITADGRIQNVLNIQPVIPVSISKDWNLILRIITPLIYQPDLRQNDRGTFGLGDMNPTFFFSPSKPGKLIWGAGPAFALPTATSQLLGQGKTSLGPGVVALVQPGPWTIGAVTSNVWSVAGPSGRPDVNQMSLQYFFVYQLGHGWYMNSGPILTANWNAAPGDKWVVPFGGGLGRVFKLGFQPVNAEINIYGNAVRPNNPPSAPWQFRFQMTLLYPQLSKADEKKMLEKKLKQLDEEQQQGKQPKK